MSPLAVELRQNPKKSMVYGTEWGYMEPYAGVDYNLTLCQLQSRLSNTFTMDNPMPESTLTLC